jgi:protein-disulfide isomerase
LVFLMVGEGVRGEGLDFLSREDGRLRGNAKAPVTLIEYSDFTCGFCQKWFQETWPRIQAKYVDTGKVRFSYRDFPRAFQGPGLDGALAARCAGEQNRYWAMHDELWGDRRLGAEDLQRHAKAVKLDLPAFATCMREERHTEDIFRDRIARERPAGGHPGRLPVRRVRRADRSFAGGRDKREALSRVGS